VETRGHVRGLREAPAALEQVQVAELAVGLLVFVPF
jgi:hypothetical protein